MDLDRVTAVVRPRSPWEAIDLGFGLARHHGRSVWRTWGLLSVPPMAAVWLLLRDAPALAFLVVWLLKPLLGVVPLFALSRALFGAPPSLGDTLRAWPGLWARNLLPALVLWRIDPRRAFRAPVWVLEGLRGGARRKRLSVIGKRHDAAALGLTLACSLLEQCLLVALLSLAWSLLPTGRGPDLGGLLEALFQRGDPLALALLALAHMGAITIVEPCYVAAGFALYVNRRVQLEGWDLELAFRKLARRLEQERVEEEETERLARAASSRRAAAIGALLLACAGLLGAASPARAQERAPQGSEDPAAAAREVLADPVFGEKKTVTRRVWRGRGCSPSLPGPRGAPPGAGALGGATRLLLVGVVAVLAVGLVALAVRAALRAGEGRRRGGKTSTLPAVLMGLDLRPESLPADVPGEARRLWQRGEHAPALSLLYRGALARLVRQHRLELPGSATEGDCLEAVRKARGPAPWFGRLTRAWQSVAYAGRVPPDAEVQALCQEWAGALHAAAEERRA